MGYFLARTSLHIFYLCISKIACDHIFKTHFICWVYFIRSSPIEGFVDDYAYVIRGLLDLYEVCHDDMWIRWAETLQERQNALFWDTEGGAYFSNSGKDASIVLRLKDGWCI